MPKLKIRGNLMMIGFLRISANQEKSLKKEGLAFESPNPCIWCTEEADYEEGFDSSIDVFLDDEIVMTIHTPTDEPKPSYNGLNSLICENPTWGAEYILNIEAEFSSDKLEVSWRKYTFGPGLNYVLGEVSYADEELEFDEGGGGTCNSYYVNAEGILYETDITDDDENNGIIITIS